MPQMERTEGVGVVVSMEMAVELGGIVRAVVEEAADGDGEAAVEGGGEAADEAGAGGEPVAVAAAVGAALELVDEAGWEAAEPVFAGGGGEGEAVNADELALSS